MSQEILAGKVSIRTSIVNIENGRHRIAAHMLVLIAEALKVKLETILSSHSSSKRQQDCFRYLPKIITTDTEIVDSETEQAVANFVLFLSINYDR